MFAVSITLIMGKSDKSIHTICIAAIKRSTIKPYDFKWTRFYEESVDIKELLPGIEVELFDNELVICSTIMDKDNFSILTTQRLATKEKGILLEANLNGAVDKLYGDFKGMRDNLLTFGLVQLNNGESLRYFIETGKASMVMIYGVRTRTQTDTTQAPNVNH